MAEHKGAEVLEAFDHDFNTASEIPASIMKCMAFIKDNTGLLGDYNTGKAKLNVSASVVMVTARSSRMRTDLLQWIDEQDDLKIGQVSIKSMAGGDTVPHIEIHQN